MAPIMQLATGRTIGPETATTSMLHTRPGLAIATRLPCLLNGPALHQGALRALHRGAYREADRLFELAASRYQKELAVEPLARLRVHQLIGRVMATASRDLEAKLCLEVERLLSRLDQIESLEPPFHLVEAHSMLATWLSGATPAATTPTAKAA